MSFNFNLPQNNVPFGGGYGFGPTGCFGGPGMGGGPSITISFGNDEEQGKCCKKKDKKSERKGGLLGGIVSGVKDFLRNIGEAFFGEKEDKKCKKGCRDRHHDRPPFGGPMASAGVMSMNFELGF